MTKAAENKKSYSKRNKLPKSCRATFFFFFFFSLFTMQFSTIEKLHVCLQVTNLLQSNLWKAVIVIFCVFFDCDCHLSDPAFLYFKYFLFIMG